MKAMGYFGPGDIRLVDRPRPRAQTGGELLLKVGTVGVCGSDAAEWSTGPHFFPIGSDEHRRGGFVFGHEFSGTVVEVGSPADSHWLGREVASCAVTSCGTCDACSSGRSNQCVDYSCVGLHRSGALADYVAVPSTSCLDVTGRLTLDQAALAQPMSIAVHAGRRGQPQPAERALVVGVGGIGVFLIHALVQWGLHVTAVDIAENRLELARMLGAQTVINSRTPAVAGDGGSFDVVYEATGKPQVPTTVLPLLRKGGRLVLIGLQHQASTLDLFDTTVRELTIIGSNGLSPAADLPEAVRLLELGRTSWGHVAPVVLPLHKLIDGAIEPLARGRGTVVKHLIDPAATTTRAFRG